MNVFERNQERLIDLFSENIRKETINLVRDIFLNGKNSAELIAHLRSISDSEVSDSLVVMLIKIYESIYVKTSKPKEDDDKFVALPLFFDTNHFKSLKEIAEQALRSVLRWFKQLIAEVAAIVADSLLFDSAMLGADIFGKILKAGFGKRSSELLKKAKLGLNKKNVDIQIFIDALNDSFVASDFYKLSKNTKNLIYLKVKNRLRKSFIKFKNNLFRIVRTSGQLTVRDAQGNSAIEIGESVTWITRDDKKVRHLHRGWHRQVFTPKQAKKNSRISPYNCRCILRLNGTGETVSAQLVAFNVEWFRILSSNPELLTNA